MASKRRSLIWILVAFMLVIVVFWSAMWALNRVVLGGSPGLATSNVLEIGLGGAIGERAITFWAGRAMGPLTVNEIDRALRRASTDQRIEAVVLRVGSLRTGFAKAQEIREAIKAFQGSGKPVVATLELASILDLYVAAAADTVVQNPSGNMVLGLLSRTQYYRELLDRLGVEFEAFRTGPYKTAMNPYTETGMGAEERAHIDGLLDSIYGQLVTDIASDRGLSVQQVEAAVDRGLLSAEAAVELGLVDELGFADSVDAHLGAAGTSRTSLRDYWQASGGNGIEWGRPVLAVVHVSGMIMPGDSGDDLFGDGGVAGGDAIARDLRQARLASDVRAIVIRVDSPGGAVTASDVIWREAALAAESKPVIISMSDVAASGGYWIATAGTRVLADPATYTGSIGVTSSRMNLRGTYEKLGIGNAVLQRGRNAGLFNDAAPLNAEQREIMNASVNANYRVFIRKVAAARNLEEEVVERLAGGRVWTGAQALEAGLVDELGGLNAALRTARVEAGLSAVSKVAVRTYPRPRGLVEQFTSIFTLASSGGVPAALQGKAATLEILLDPNVRRRQLQLLQRFSSSGRSWAILDGAVPVPAR